MDELINPVTGGWDVELIKSLFWEIDVARILQIPLRQGRDDAVAWQFTKNGLFTVGSAYHLQWAHKFGANIVNDLAGGAGDEQVWAKLWKLEVPSKIKIFGWRVLHGLIPCKGILANRHIENSSSCPACHSSCEDIKHVLFTCDRAKEIWRILGVSEIINMALSIHQSGSVIVADMITMARSVEELNKIRLAELILTGGWYIWWERRKLTHGETIQNPTKAALSIATLTTNYQRSAKHTRATKKKQVGWKRPPEDELLLNFDASYKPESSTGSSGAIIRDHTGAFVAAKVNYFENVANAAAVEVVALREGLLLAQMMGCNRIRIQSDCSEVVETMIQGGVSATISAPIYEQCNLLWLDFAAISCEHCNREANVVAHELAREAMKSKLSCNWIDEPPRLILGALVNDVSMIQDE